MFVRVKNVGTYRYLQIAENRREGNRVKQTIIATLGRLDKLAASGAFDQLLRSATRFAERVMVLSEHSRDAHDRPDANVVSIGPALIFERLWRETGCQEVVRKLLATRVYRFDVERAVFMTVLHRLMVSGSDRSALQWRRDQAIDGTEALELQHLYRAMGWLGEALGEREPDAPSPRRICGHVFCSFLALLLRDELIRRIDNAGVTAEWDDILRDLNALTETAITYNGKTFAVRSNAVGVAGKIAQCVGVRLPNTVRQVDVEKEAADPSP